MAKKKQVVEAVEPPAVEQEVPAPVSAYPCWRYHDSQPPVLVRDAEHEKALGKGWHDSPATGTE